MRLLDESVRFGGVRLNAAGALVFRKLVGCITKEGKKGTARNVLLDAMQIMRRELGKAASASPTAATAAAAGEPQQQAVKGGGGSGGKGKGGKAAAGTKGST